jgi:hypothetical protein
MGQLGDIAEYAGILVYPCVSIFDGLILFPAIPLDASAGEYALTTRTNSPGVCLSISEYAPAG